MSTQKNRQVGIVLGIIYLGGGCHEEVDVGGTSVTDVCGILDCTTTSSGSTSEAIPTTTEPNPLEYCRLGPEPGFAGVSYVCAGKARGHIGFEYFGDPELNINAALGCVELEG